MYLEIVSDREFSSPAPLAVAFAVKESYAGVFRRGLSTIIEIKKEF
jgi:hypothetical protein